MKTIHSRSRQSRARGFNLIEVLIAVLLAGIVMTSIYLGISHGLRIVQVARENLRASQILVEKMETIRLYTWEQINQEDYIPKTFEAPFYCVGGTNSGIIYSGTFELSDSDTGANYGPLLKTATFTIEWQSAGNKGDTITRSRAMSTYVTQNGLQAYIY